MASTQNQPPPEEKPVAPTSSKNTEEVKDESKPKGGIDSFGLPASGQSSGR